MFRTPPLLALSVMAALSGISSSGAARPEECGRTLADQTRNCARTLLDMRTVQTAIEAYAIDHQSYPAARSMEELRAAIQPTYIQTTPLTDAWGNDLRYIPSADLKSYRLVSAGSDRAFDEESWSKPGLLGSSTDDAVFSALGPGGDREWVIQEWVIQE